MCDSDMFAEFIQLVWEISLFSLAQASDWTKFRLYSCFEEKRGFCIKVRVDCSELSCNKERAFARAAFAKRL